MEFLMGRLLVNNMMNLGIYQIAKDGLEEYGITVIRFSNAEVDRHFESVCEVIDKAVRALIKEI